MHAVAVVPDATCDKFQERTSCFKMPCEQVLHRLTVGSRWPRQWLTTDVLNDWRKVVHQEVIELNSPHGVRKVTLESRDGHGRGERRLGKSLQGFQAIHDPLEELVRAGCGQNLSRARRQDPLCGLSASAALELSPS